jgi:hypothetical protein
MYLLKNLNKFNVEGLYIMISDVKESSYDFIRHK